MKVLCFGAGAVGCLVSAKLAAAGNDVSLLARPDAAAVLRRRGLSIHEPAGRVVYARPRILADLSEWHLEEAAPELIVLAVKAYDVPAVAPLLARVAAEYTAVLMLQNGLGCEEAACDALGPERVVAGSFTLSVSMPETGAVEQHTSSGGVALADLQPDAKRMGLLTQLFAYSGMNVRVFPSWRAMKWSKLLLNILGNATCAILEMTPAEVFADPRTFAIEQRAFGEARRVMRRLRLGPAQLPGYPVRALCTAMGLPAPLARPLIAGKAGGGRGDKPPSLALDLARGKGRSEVSFLNGAVARAAGECGLPAAANAGLCEILLALAAGTADRAAYRRNPEALLAQLR